MSKNVQMAHYYHVILFFDYFFQKILPCQHIIVDLQRYQKNLNKEIGPQICQDT